MTCRLGQVLLLGGLLWRARLGWVLAISWLLFGARLLFALLRVAWLLLLTLTLTRRLVAIACGSWRIIASLSVCLARRTRSLLGDMGWRHKAVYRNYWNLAFDQSFDVSEKL